MNNKNVDAIRKIFSMNRAQEYFNGRFELLIFLINGIFILYSIASIILYFFYHIFGNHYIFSDRTLYENNPGLNKEYLDTYLMNDISLFWNIFSCVILLCFVFFGQILVKQQKYLFLFLYLGFLKLFVFGYFMNKNMTLIPHQSSFIYHIFNIVLMIPIFLIFCYSAIYYKRKYKINNTQSSTLSYNYSKNQENNFNKYTIKSSDTASFGTIVDEIQLRLDMAKIRFNAFMIKFRLHKIFGRFLFHEKDYYFMNKQKKEKEKEAILKSTINKSRETKNNSNVSVFSEVNSTTFASDSLNTSYSKLDDDEVNPLKPH